MAVPDGPVRRGDGFRKGLNPSPGFCMKSADKTFRDEIDCRFPYNDLDQGKSLIDRSVAISPEAVFAVLHEICRPGRGEPVPVDRLLQLLRYWRSRFDHPIADMMRDAASSMIHGRYLSVEEVIAQMRILAEYPGLYSALAILYFSCDDVEDRLEPIVAAIKERWKTQPSGSQ